MAQLQRKQPTAQSDHDTDAAQLRDAIRGKLTYELGKNADTASDYDWYQATALAVRDRIVDTWLNTRDETKRQKKKRVYYLSIEFLIGRMLFDTLTNLRLVNATRSALADLGSRSRHFAAGGTRCGTRQWRVGPARGLLHGQHVGTRHSGLRLRHPLRVRAVRAAPGRRSAAGTARGLARARQSVGIRARQFRLHDRLRRHGRIYRRRRRHGARGLVSGRGSDGRALRYAGRGLARPSRQCAAVVVGARCRSDSTGRAPSRRLCRRDACP